MARSEAGFQDRFRRYRILIDGVEVGRIRRGETLRFPVPAGRHSLRLKIDWVSSRAWPFTVANGQAKAFGCAPGGGFGGADDADGEYLVLRPVSDAAEIEAIPPSPGNRLMSAVAVLFVADSIAVIGGFIWHVCDAGSVVGQALLGGGVVAFVAMIIIFKVLGKLLDP